MERKMHHFQNFQNFQNFQFFYTASLLATTIYISKLFKI